MNQPLNVYPSFVGLTGFVTVSPSSTVWLSVSVPPFESNIIVNASDVVTVVFKEAVISTLPPTIVNVVFSLFSSASVTFDVFTIHFSNAFPSGTFAVIVTVFPSVAFSKSAVPSFTVIKYNFFNPAIASLISSAILSTLLCSANVFL